MATAIALFTRDLRVHDNPVLAAAARAEFTVPLFVMDADISALGFAGRPRAGFLGGCVADLDGALGGLGAGLVMRRALVVHEGVHTVVAPGAVTPAGSDHFAMFTPYWRRWSDTPMRALVAPPRRLRLPRLAEQTIRVPAEADAGALLPGGESAARARAKVWLARGLERYADRHDTPGVDGTSRLSPYLHFGCISAAELVGRVRRLGRSSAAADAFVRQLAWRDFYAQLLAARPDAAHEDYRRRIEAWRDDPASLAAWQAGQTGYPIVDAGMRQLAAEGWMHNRARLITGSFLTKTLGIDWRAGAAHFFTHLLDGDIANNCLNWQWVAGTGTDSRPYRRLNPVRQAGRFDPDATYVRRWVPELAGLADDVIHQPWRLAAATRTKVRYPEPIVPPTGG